jgi:UDP:flavonoid glycosyltransferase YjiC (YdhE family)
MPSSAAPRVVVAWELGTYLGHLERDLPVAQRLRELGAEVQFVVSDLRAAELRLAPAGFPILPCPAIQRSQRRPGSAINFSEVLLEMGFDDAIAIRARVRAWLELWKVLSPDVILIDFSPTALLSARIAGIPTVSLGPGFTVPPARDPMPAFREVPPTSDAALRAADKKVLDVVNQVCASFGCQPFESVGAWFDTTAVHIASFAELDPFGPRSSARYVGPIYDKGSYRQEKWLGSRSTRVFAYLQSALKGLDAILDALKESDFEVICVVPGASRELAERYQNGPFRLFSEPLALESLLAEADAVVGYGSAGMVSNALLAGTPMLLFPAFMEQNLNATRAARLGAAIVSTATPVRAQVLEALKRLLSDARYKQAARAFAEKYRSFQNDSGINEVSKAILGRVASLANRARSQALGLRPESIS